MSIRAAGLAYGSRDKVTNNREVWSWRLTNDRQVNAFNPGNSGRVNSGCMKTAGWLLINCLHNPNSERPATA